MFRTTVFFLFAVCTVLFIFNGVYGYDPEDVIIRTEYMTDSNNKPYAKYTATHRNTVLWEFVTPGQTNAEVTGIDYFKIPDIVLIPVGSDLYALDLKTGEQRWTVEGTGIGISLTSDRNNNIFVTSFSQPDLSVISHEGELLRRIQSFDDNRLNRPIQIKILGEYLKLTYSISDIQGLENPKNQGIYPDIDYKGYDLHCIYVRIDDLLAKPPVNNGILTPLSALKPLVKQNEIKAGLNTYIYKFLEWPVYFYKFDVLNVDKNSILEMMFTYDSLNNDFVEYVEDSPLYRDYSSLQRTTPEKYSEFCKKIFGIDIEFDNYIKDHSHLIFMGDDGYIYDGTWYGGHGGYGVDSLQINTVEPIGEAKYKTYYLEFDLYNSPETDDISLYEAQSVYDSLLLKSSFNYFDLPMEEWVFGGEESFTVTGRGSAIVREVQEGQWQLKYMNFVQDTNDYSFIMSPEDRQDYIQDIIPDKKPILPSALPKPSISSWGSVWDLVRSFSNSGEDNQTADNFDATPKEENVLEINLPMDIPIVPITLTAGITSFLSGVGLFIYNRIRFK